MAQICPLFPFKKPKPKPNNNSLQILYLEVNLHYKTLHKNHDDYGRCDDYLIYGNESHQVFVLCQNGI
jgi:hypothetical protein